MPDKKPCLPRAVAQTLENILHILIPMDDSFFIDGLDGHLVRQAERMLFEFSGLYRFIMIWGLRFFEWCPFLFGFGFIPYSRLAPKHQLRYLQNWESSRIGWRRQFFGMMRGMILMIACTHEKVWQHIGYDPEAHMHERIELRKRLVSS